MSLPESLDQEKLAEAALAILSLTARDEEFGARAWKGMDWDLTDLLHEKGWIIRHITNQICDLGSNRYDFRYGHYPHRYHMVTAHQ